MRVTVVGLGTAGATLACLLADDGHEVTVVERAADPRPVGAGLWLQSLGQQVLDRLDLLAPLRERSTVVDRIAMRDAGGRSLVDLRYADRPGATPALGVGRGDLFALLLGAVGDRGVPVATGRTVTGVRPTPSGIVVSTDAGDLPPSDLVVGADGSRSAVRAAMSVTVRDRPYAWGALWAVVDDPDGLAGGTLTQVMAGTRRYLGVLPTGRGRASLFWSVRRAESSHIRDDSASLAAWREEAAPLAGVHAPLLERVTARLPAGYRDVAVRTPYRLGDPGAAVLIGDAAHAMSPQLGVGTSLALADVATLAWALRERDLGIALAAYEHRRRAHLRWYAWTTRLMTPLFQSDLTPLALPRDRLAPSLSRLPGVPPLLVGVLCGDRTSPWTSWRLPD